MRLKQYFFTYILLLLLSFNLQAQQNAYPVKTVDGVEYYEYTVGAGEGLYAISKKFSTTQAEINRLNPHILDGLKAGEKILVPKTIAANPNISQNQPNNLRQNYDLLEHKVERKQTLFGISRKYNVPQDLIVNANPGIMQRGLQEGDILLIPIKKTGAESSQTQTQLPEGNYIEHKVQMLETLYSLSRKYNVSVNEIKAFNPSAATILKAGTVLKIPQKNEAVKNEISADIKDTPQTNVSYITHRVSQGETLYAISRLYNVSVNELKAHNPESAEVLSVGTNIRVPQKGTSPQRPTVQPETKQQTQPEEPEKKRGFFERISDVFSTKSDKKEVVEDSEYITHKVQVFETLYSIGRKYGVSVDQLKELNPDSADKLKVGTILRIAKRKPDVKPVEKKEPDKIVEKTVYNVAYLLPFMQNSPNDPTATRFVEFYMGSLLALNSVKNGNMKFEVFAYDTEKSEAKVRQLLNKPEMKNMDLIIGPAYTTQIKPVADFAKTHKINTLIPFSSRVNEIDNNPYLFQFNPDQSTQNKHLVELMKTQFGNHELLMVENGASANSNGFFDDLKHKLNASGIRYKLINKNAAAQLEHHLSSLKNNMVIFESEAYDTVSDNLSKLYQLRTQFNIVVVGQYAWRDRAGAKPKMYYIAPFKGNRTGTSYYESEFKKYFGEVLGGNNPRFDLIGYDLSNYFLSTMKKDGFSFDKSAAELNYNNAVQSELQFKRTSSNSGYINHKTYLIVDEAKSK